MPAYFDRFVAAVRHGARIDHVHLGHWDPGDVPGGTPEDFEAAQARLAAKLIDMADLRPGQRLLDVGCGFGGLARQIDAGPVPVGFVGVNIDVRQLAVCRTLRCRGENTFDWVGADACALPFSAEAFDAVFCVEAMFHFASRTQFLAEAFRVLKPGGVFVASDILLQRPAPDARLAPAHLEAVLERDLGPWPEKWLSPAGLRAHVSGSGLRIEAEVDATDNILPSYRTIAPADLPDVTGPAAMRILQMRGCLRYAYLRARKPPAHR